MKVRLHDITVRSRIRRDLGDIPSLMESLRTHGLLNPVVISPENELIAGFRRYESARRLGWDLIDAVVLDRDSELAKLEIEIEENVQRKDLTPDELAEAYERMEKLRNPGFLHRMWRALLLFLRRLFGREKR